MKNVTKSIFKKIAAAGAVLFCFMAFAQETEEVPAAAENKNVVVLTVDEAVDYMLQNSRTLKVAELDLELAKFKKNTAWNVFLPELSVSGTLSRSNKWSNQSAGMIPLYNAVGGLMATSSIPDFQKAGPKLLDAAKQMDAKETESRHWTAVGKIGVNWTISAAYIQQMRAVIESYESGKLTWADTVKQNELNVRKLFYAILLQQESVKLQQRSLENARQRMNQASVNFRNGYTSQLNLLQTQVAYENLRPNVEKSEEGLKQNLDMLAFLIGYPNGTVLELSGDLKTSFVTIDEEAVMSKVDDNNSSIQQLKQGIKLLKLQKSAMDLGAYAPALVMSWAYQPTSIGSDGAFAMNWSKEDNWRDTGTLGFTLAWNITNMLPFSSNRIQAKEVSNKIKSNELSLETLRQKTNLEVKTAIDTLNQAKKAIEASERQIDLARRSYEMTLQAYRNGTRELLDVNDAETQLNQAELGLANEQYNYITSIMDLEYKLNTKLSE